MSTNNPCQQLAPPIPQILHDPGSCSSIAEGQCDCACAVGPHKRQRATLDSLSGITSARLAQPCVVVPLRSDYYAALVSQSSGAIVLNESALTIACYFERPRATTDLPVVWLNQWGSQVVADTLERMVQLGLLTPADRPIPKVAEIPTTLVAWLHLTDRCNLRCAYCYLPHAPTDMSLATGQAALDATFHSAAAHGYRQVKLKYAGGEPLLRFPLIADLQRSARSLAESHGLGLDAVVLSNGTLLTEPIVEAMKSLNIRLMISLDGLDSFHDRQRFYAGGRGSFAEAERAIMLARAHQLVPDISVTISASNVEGLPDLVEWLLNQDLPFNFNFYRENACSAGRRDLSLMESDLVDGMLKVFGVIESNLPKRSILNSLVDRGNFAAPHLHTCLAGHSSLVFDPIGRVAKCQMLLDQAISNAWAPDPLLVISQDTATLQNPSVENKEGCKDCEWRFWCTGGCPLATWRATGRYDVRSPNCRIYQALFPAALRLEGLRMLKYAV